MQEVTTVRCTLLHVLEEPDPDPYADPGVKDVLGKLPRFFCTGFDPLLALPPSDAVKCLQRETPCWKPPGERPATTG